MDAVIKVTSPFNGKLLEEIPLTGPDEAEKAVTEAHELFQDLSRRMPAFQRIEILEKLAAIMKANIDPLVALASEEGGKPLEDSRLEVVQALNNVKLAVHHISRMGGREFPMGITRTSTQRKAFTVREPIGTAVCVNAFNEPLNLAVLQAIPAIAVGTPAIIKPATLTPLSCLKLMELLEEAGLPPGWCRAVVCDMDTTEKLVTDSRINYFSFIGSYETGWRLRSKLPPGTRCTLAHGSASPVIVEPDASLEEALPLLARGGFYHAGQVCGSVQRVYVHKDIMKKVSEGLKSIAEKFVVGDPMNKDTEMGPLILPEEVERVDRWVKEAEEKGGKILCGGKSLPNNCYAPTIILEPPDDAGVSTKEIFGPVICLYSYEDRLDAIKRANALPLSYQASVFTHNLDTALDCVNRLNASAVMVNDHTAFRMDWMPYGGRDASGMGQGGIPYAMYQLTNEKIAVIKSPVL
jgi:acyl-CoA reductase-like NAD-dependent aldehyde dehydrogenase